MNRNTRLKNLVTLTILAALICCSCSAKETPVTESNPPVSTETATTEAAVTEDAATEEPAAKEPAVEDVIPGDIDLEESQFYATDLTRISDDENSIMYQTNAVDSNGNISEIIFILENKEENELDTTLNYIFTTKGIQTMSIPPQMPVASYEVAD